MSTYPTLKRARATQEAYDDDDEPHAEAKTAAAAQAAAQVAAEAAAAEASVAKAKAVKAKAAAEQATAKVCWAKSMAAKAVDEAADAKAAAEEAAAEADAARAVAAGNPPRCTWDQELDEARNSMAVWVFNNMPRLKPKDLVHLVGCGESAMATDEYSATYTVCIWDWLAERGATMNPFWRRVMDAWLLVSAVEEAAIRARDA